MKNIIKLLLSCLFLSGLIINGSTSYPSELYDKGLKAGALGGKLLGAGGGGFLVFYVEPDKQEKVKKAMEDLLYIPFEFEDGGTRVIHYSPETYEPII